ncbi:MAG: hypothetical protein AAF804_08820 [Bacteroidota bacterium]
MNLFRNPRLFIPVASLALGLLVSCNSSPIEPPGALVPTVLDCAFFSANENITLENNDDLAVDYIVECRADIDGDLVIQPGVTIEFTEDGGLNIRDEGSISAVGTEDSPILMTAQNKIPGFWSGIQVQSNSVVNQLEYVTIAYAGGEAFNSNDNQGNLIYWPGSRLSVDHCTFTNSGSNGVYINDQVEIPSFADNEITDNEVPVYMFASEWGALGSGNDFTGNTNDYINSVIADMPTGTSTIKSLGVPYRIQPGSFGIFREVTLPSGADVLVEPGVTMEFTDDTGIRTIGGSSFRAVGSESMPITFTGVNKVAGAWKGLHFRFSTSPNNILENVRIEFAGSDGDTDAAIFMWADPVLTVNNSEIYDIDGCAFTSGTGGETNPNLTYSNVDVQRITGETECF